MNRMTKKRVGMVLAFSLTLTGAAAYIGIQQENTDKTEAAGSLTAGVSASLNASEVEALDVTAGVTSQLYDKTDVAVAANEKQMVAQGIEDTQTKEAVSENTTEDTSICGYKNLGIAQVQGSLNVRKKASTDSKVVGKMTDKDACEIVSVKGDWAKITSGKVEGYVKTEGSTCGKRRICIRTYCNSVCKKCDKRNCWVVSPGFFAVITPFSSTEAMLERADLYVTGCPVDVSAFSRAVYPFSKDMVF